MPKIQLCCFPRDRFFSWFVPDHRNIGANRHASVNSLLPEVTEAEQQAHNMLSCSITNGKKNATSEATEVVNVPCIILLSEVQLSAISYLLVALRRCSG